MYYIYTRKKRFEMSSLTKYQMAEFGIPEEYETIRDYPEYEVSNYGNVRHAKTKNVQYSFLNSNGYYFVMIRNRRKNVHRLVMEAFALNVFNKPCIDHIDGNKTNNCIYNLRYATYQENNFNTKIRSDNTSGSKGVMWHKKRSKWVSVIYYNKKMIHIGYFELKDDAIHARQLKARELFGQFIHSSEM